MIRRSRQILYLMLTGLFAVMSFLSCSSPSISGATDTETGNVIAGIVLDNNGCAVAGAPVTLIPEGYDPLKDAPLPDSFSTVTNSDGSYSFSAENTGSFNIYCNNPSDNTGFLHTGITFDPAGTVHDTGVLAPTGFLMVKLPDTVDVNLGYLYFSGTTIYRELQTMADGFADGFTCIFDALPPAVMPHLYYAERESDEGSLLATSVTIVESDSVVLETSTEQTKPLWRFSILVGVKNTVSAYFGGLDNMISRIDSQFNVVTERYNSTDRFNGTFLIVADSVYEYSGTVSEEGNKDPGRFDYRMLYDNTDQPVVLHEITRSNYLYLWGSPPDYLFKDICTDYFTGTFGDCRGAFNLSWANVNASGNPITHTSFTAEPSIFHNPELYSEWDDYSISVINYNAGNTGSEREILHTAFPDSMGISVTTTSGIAVPDAAVKVYGSILNTASVSEDTLLTGMTDNNGNFLFPFNPFLLKTTGMITCGNLLITITTDSDSTSTWYPVYEAGNAYFSDTSAPYYKEVSF